jgi:hypothetical protein
MFGQVEINLNKIKSLKSLATSWQGVRLEHDWDPISKLWKTEPPMHMLSIVVKVPPTGEKKL